MKIGQIATEAGVTVDTVRFYERVSVLPPPALTDAVDALAAHDAGGATCESEHRRLQAVLDRVDDKLADLNALRRTIVQAQPPDRTAVRHAEAPPTRLPDRSRRCRPQRACPRHTARDLRCSSWAYTSSVIFESVCPT